MRFDQYLEPVIFHNVNGPDIGVTTCGVIVKDGLYFKDLDNSGELAPYKDWRLSPEQRAEDMVKHLRLDQQAGLVLNTLFNSPVVPTRAEATNAEGKLELGKIYKHHNPGEKPMPGPLPGMTVSIDDSHVLEKHIAAGVYRGDMRCEAGMVALYHNAGTQMLEYEACKGGVAIPYSLHTNPINIGVQLNITRTGFAGLGNWPAAGLRAGHGIQFYGDVSQRGGGVCCLRRNGLAVFTLNE